jgi:hypothetical protein
MHRIAKCALLILLLCVLTGASDGPPKIATIPNAKNIVIPTTDLDVGILDLKQDTTFTGTSGTAWNWQRVILDIGATAVYTLTWDPIKFKETYLPFPKKTVVAPKRLLIMLKYDSATTTWAIMSTNEAMAVP